MKENKTKYLYNAKLLWNIIVIFSFYNLVFLNTYLTPLKDIDNRLIIVIID
jgi:hypothetical protein